jgi:hypothetical protein
MFVDVAYLQLSKRDAFAKMRSDATQSRAGK